MGNFDPKCRRRGKGFRLTYVLDQNKETDAVAAAAEHRFAVGKVIDMGNAQKDGEITLSPEQWLYNIKNCRYMVTDSFHGACFAIIFNKPFICVANRERGISRFESLFDMLGLSSRLVKNGETLDGRADLLKRLIMRRSTKSWRRKLRGRAAGWRKLCKTEGAAEF